MNELLKLSNLTGIVNEHYPEYIEAYPSLLTKNISGKLISQRNLTEINFTPIDPNNSLLFYIQLLELNFLCPPGIEARPLEYNGGTWWDGYAHTGTSPPPGFISSPVKADDIIYTTDIFDTEDKAALGLTGTYIFNPNKLLLVANTFKVIDDSGTTSFGRPQSLPGDSLEAAIEYIAGISGFKLLALMRTQYLKYTKGNTPELDKFQIFLPIFIAGYVP